MDGRPRRPGGPSAPDLLRLAHAAGLPGRSLASVLVGTLGRLGTAFAPAQSPALAEGLARVAGAGAPGGLDAWAASRTLGPPASWEPPPVRFLRGLVLVGAAAGRAGRHAAVGDEGRLVLPGLVGALQAWGEARAAARTTAAVTPPANGGWAVARAEAMTEAYDAARAEARAALPLAAVLMAATEGLGP